MKNLFQSENQESAAKPTSKALPVPAQKIEPFPRRPQPSVKADPTIPVVPPPPPPPPPRKEVKKEVKKETRKEPVVGVFDDDAQIAKLLSEAQTSVNRILKRSSQEATTPKEEDEDEDQEEATMEEEELKPKSSLNAEV